MVETKKMIDADQIRADLLYNIYKLKLREPVIAGHSMLRYKRAVECILETLEKQKVWEVDINV